MDNNLLQEALTIAADRYFSNKISESMGQPVSALFTQQEISLFSFSGLMESSNLEFLNEIALIHQQIQSENPNTEYTQPGGINFITAAIRDDLAMSFMRDLLTRRLYHSGEEVMFPPGSIISRCLTVLAEFGITGDRVTQDPKLTNATLKSLILPVLQGKIRTSIL